jgi:predicted phage terminase large subunit-like protein
MVAALISYENLQADKARRDFSLFVKLAWPQIEPGRPFVGGWHLDAISEHLQAVYTGDIKRLLVNMPPRHGKSSLISVLYTSWLLLNNPSLRLLCGSYAMDLATRDNLKARRLIKTPWFQERYGYAFSLTKDQNVKKRFDTDKLGYRMAVSVGSSATGEGGDILIGDDFHNIKEKESNAKREAALDWFDNTWCTRLNSQVDGAMITVGQRIHQNDVSGHILANNYGGEWIHLNLAAEYEPRNACTTFYPGTNKVFWKDPRKDENELLWPPRFPQKVIDRAKKIQGPLDYAAIFQQSPVPPGGYIFNKEHERLFTVDTYQNVYLLETDEGIRPVVISQCHHFTTSDVAVKKDEHADYTVFCTWAITPAREVLLLDVKRAHLSIPEQQKQGKRVFYEFNESPNYLCLFFEDVGYQSAIGQNLIAEGIPCMPFHPQGKGDKVMRAGAASIWMNLHKVFFKKNAPWLEEFQLEIYMFPKAANDDQVDNLSMVCILVRPGGDFDTMLGELDQETQELLANYRGY